MVSRWAERQATIAAARARYGSKGSASASPAGNQSQKSNPQQRDTIEEQQRDSVDESSREQVSVASTRSQSLRRNAHRSLHNRSSIQKDDAADASSADSGSIFGSADKRQKKIVYNKFTENAIEALQVVVEDIPKPIRSRDVVIKVSASSVSYSDCMIRRGICFDIINPTDLPATPGMDAVGNIVAVGSRVKRFQVGDRVATLCRTGGNARYITSKEDELVHVPRSCDAAEAVCMVSTFMTAYQSLRMVTRDSFSMKGKRILVTGGIEPIGQALIQLCFRAGAEEVYATAPDHRHRYIKTVLRAHPLPVNPSLWPDTIQGSMDVVFDGTCYDSLESPSASLNQDGTLVCLGMSALLNREKPGLLGAPIAAYWAKIKGQIMMTNTQSYEVWESFLDDKDAYKLDLEILFHLLKKRFLKPHISKRICLSEVAEAHSSLEKETARGEIVCLPWKRLSK